MTGTGRLVLVGYALLLAAWGLGNPAFAAPDEPAQYVRGLGLVGGDLGGSTPAYPQPPGTRDEDAYRRLTRVFDVPADLAPTGQIPCFAFHSAKTADCDAAGTPFGLSAAQRLDLDPHGGLVPMIARLDAVEGPQGVELAAASYQAVYPPAALGVAGLAGRLGWSPGAGLLLARAAAGAICLAFLVVGWRWLLDATGPIGPRVAAGLLAFTPMALFVSSTVSGSGLELAAAFAWVCGLLRAARGPMSGRSLVALAVTGVAITTTRQFGPVWLVLTLVTVVAAGGLPVARRRLAEQPRAAIVGGVLVGLGLTFAVAWTMLVFPPAPPRSQPGSLSGIAGQSVGAFGRLAREMVGVFGWLDTIPPALVPLGWGAMVVALVAVACMVGLRHDRQVLAGIGAGLVAITLGVSALAYTQQTGAQGRWVLPAAVALPLVAGEVVARRWPRFLALSLPFPRKAVVGCAAVVAALHGLSLWANARRYAVGSHGPLLFAGESRWAPPGGWWPVAALVVGGLAALVAGTAATVAGDVDRVDRVDQPAIS